MLLLGAVSAGYLEMMRIPPLAGRYLLRSDGAGSAGVAVISTAAAKHFWPGQSAIGKHIRPASGKQWLTVAGAVGDVRHAPLSKGLPDWVKGAIYLLYPQAITEDGKLPAAMTLLVKVDANHSRLRSDIRQLAVNIDPNVPVGRVQALDAMVWVHRELPLDDAGLSQFCRRSHRTRRRGDLWIAGLLGQPADV
jgi:putative ABC transport system permease protein